MSKQVTPPPPGDKPAPTAPPSPPRWRHWLWPVALIAFALLWLVLPTVHANQVSLSYSEFLSRVSSHQVKTVTLGANGQASGTLKNGSTYETVIPSQAGQQFLNDLQAADVQITASTPGPSFGSEVLTWVLLLSPFLLFGWLWMRLSRGAGGQLQGVLGVGRSRAKVFDAERPKTRFSDVAGYEGAKAEIVEVVDFLRNPDRYRRAGATPPRGVLMVGPPGTGKTLIARAVAGEADVVFFSVAGSSFVELFVGVGAARVRDLFAEARKRAPAIIFIDELDAIGRARGPTTIGASSEQEQTLNQILTEMDGFSSREGIIVLAATNQPDVLDRALLRPGRFDRRVIVNLPDKNGREAILAVHTRQVPIAADASLAELAAATPGFSGAELKNLVNEAALLAARRNENAVGQTDFLDALEKIVLGPARPILLSRADRERIAYHEGGHAILGLVVPGADPVHRVTIVPRGQALGVTYQRPDSDRYNYPEAYLRARIVGMLGGRAAEEIIYGTKTTGAESDIEQATGLARRMVTRWGMSDRVGMVQLAPRENPYLNGPEGYYPGAKPFSEETAEAIDAEVRKIIGDSHVEATRLLTRHRSALEALAQALLSRETLNEQEILDVTGLPSAPKLEGAMAPSAEDAADSLPPA